MAVAVLALSVATGVATGAPTDMRTLDRKAQAHLDMGQAHTARAAKLKAEGREEPARKELAQAKREFATAATLWRQALALSPKTVMTYVRLGTALTLEGRYPEAQRVFEKGLRVKPDAPMLLFHMGTLLMHQRRYARARDYFNRTLKVAEWYPNAHYMLGYIHELDGKYKLAGKEYVAERRIDAANMDATARLMMLQKQGKFGRNWDVKDRWTTGSVVGIALTIAIGLAIFAFGEIRKKSMQQIRIERLELGRSPDNPLHDVQ